MTIKEEATTTNDVPQRMGAFSIQAENPGIDPKSPIKRKKHRSKAEYSAFSNDKDAAKEYITGTMDNNGRSRVAEAIDRRVNRMLMEADLGAHAYFDDVLDRLKGFVDQGQLSSDKFLNSLGDLVQSNSGDDAVKQFSGHVTDLANGQCAQDINGGQFMDPSDFRYVCDYAKRRSVVSDWNPNEYLDKNPIQIKIKSTLPSGQDYR